MNITKDTKIHDLLKAHPFLEDFLIGLNPAFGMLRNAMARATIGRVATLGKAAKMADLDADALIEAIRAEIERRTGDRSEASPPTPSSDTSRRDALKSIIRHLHDGGDPEIARQRFARAVKDIDASEIAAMEEELIREGLPVTEIQRLCDVHVGAFRDALDEQQDTEMPPGHPVHTYRADNEIINAQADALADLAREAEHAEDASNLLNRAESVLDKLQGLENHYQRKENQLFPLLERHDITGPSQVMWGIHDEIRAAMKQVRGAVQAADVTAFRDQAPGLARAIGEMVYKENKILLPLSMQTLSADEWAEMRRGEDELGYALFEPAAPWPSEGAAKADASTPTDEVLALKTGALNLETINLIFSHLPVDLSFVDEHDVVRFYSESPHRIFPRSPGVIGRKVQNCHPPKSVHMVEDILTAFREGRQDAAEFWIQMGGQFIHIRYFAVRDQAGTYRGCLEVGQDVTDIKALKGERRLLEWGRDA